MKRACIMCLDEQPETPDGIHGWFVVYDKTQRNICATKFDRVIALGNNTATVCGMTCLLKYISQEMSWR